MDSRLFASRDYVFTSRFKFQMKLREGNSKQIIENILSIIKYSVVIIMSVVCLMGVMIY